jgi:hypothetical protein
VPEPQIEVAAVTEKKAYEAGVQLNGKPSDSDAGVLVSVCQRFMGSR